MQELRVWDLVLSELVRQCHVQCAERGILLERLRVRYREPQPYRPVTRTLNPNPNRRYAYLVRAQTGYMHSYQKMTECVLEQCNDFLEEQMATETSTLTPERRKEEKIQSKTDKNHYAMAKQDAGRKAASLTKMSAQKKRTMIKDMKPEEKGDFLLVCCSLLRASLTLTLIGSLLRASPFIAPGVDDILVCVLWLMSYSIDGVLLPPSLQVRF